MGRGADYTLNYQRLVREPDDAGTSERRMVSERPSSNMYTVPDRQWDFDPQLADLAMLPPMTPTFIYVNQIVIAEDFR